MDGSGHDLATGRPPAGRGAATPAAALAAAPVVAWPLRVVAQGGARLGLGHSLGPGGDRVEALLDRLMAPSAPDTAGLSALATSTPAGAVQLPVDVVPLEEAAEAAEAVDAAWLAEVERLRSAPRSALVDSGRETELEAALHVAMVLAVERLAPTSRPCRDVGPTGGPPSRHGHGEGGHMASGAQLWLLAGAVAWALSTAGPNPFGPWAELVADGLWPVGPRRGRLVVGDARPTRWPAVT